MSANNENNDADPCPIRRLNDAPPRTIGWTLSRSASVTAAAPHRVVGFEVILGVSRRV